MLAGTFRIFNYPAESLIILGICAVLDFSALSTQVIACQSGELGLVSIIGYSIVIYSFLADLIIFHVTLTGLQFLGAGIILVVTIGTVLIKNNLAKKAE